jgi:hypothetical protein
MTSASSRAVLQFVVRRGEFAFRRLVLLAATFMRQVCLAVLRTIIFGVVFTVCAMVMMHYLGLPVAVPPEVLDTLESLGRLTRILS